MAEDNKGVVAQYNKSPVTQRDYYYDYETTDKEAKDKYADSMFNLKKTNDGLKKELESEKAAKWKEEKVEVEQKPITKK
jgi:hypothetical protein